MSTFVVSITWMLRGSYTIQAADEAAAREEACAAALPRNGEYVYGSFAIVSTTQET